MSDVLLLPRTGWFGPRFTPGPRLQGPPPRTSVHARFRAAARPTVTNPITIVVAPTDHGRPITRRPLPALMIDRRELADSAETAEPMEPMEPIEAAEPIDAIDATDPIEPTDSTEPRHPMHSRESSDHSDHFERIGPRLLRDRAARGQPTMNW